MAAVLCVDVYRPIHDAVEADSIATVRVLLCAGADVTMKKYSGETLLHLAKSAEMKYFIEGLLTDCFYISATILGIMFLCPSSVCVCPSVMFSVISVACIEEFSCQQCILGQR